MAKGQNVKLGKGQVGYYDDQGNPIVVMGNLGNAQTGIQIQDDNGDVIALLGKNASGQVVVSFNGDNGTTLAFGQQNGGGLGLTSTTSDGKVLFKTDGQSWFWYDTSGNIVMQVGLLQLLNTYGWAVATPGQTLEGQV